jgi:hypothetical protein
MRVLAYVTMLACLWSAPVLAAGYAELDDARITEIAAHLPPNPAGFGPVCTDRAAWGTPEIAVRLKAVIEAADALLNKDFPAWDDAAYLEYSQRGSRLNGERMMNARKAWLYPLVLAECVAGAGRYLRAIERTLGELDDQPTWTWPAHDAALRNFLHHDYEVDLVAADTAHDIAQALYMLGDKLPPALRTRTLDALNLRVFAPVRRTLATGDRDNSWLRADHNWNAVCLKGVVIAALTVLADRRDRAAFAAAGEHYIAHYVSSFTPDGYTSEGPSYWNYGFSHFTELREALFTATHGALDLFSSDKVRNMALYGYRFEMLPGNVAPFGDASPRTRMDDFARAYANQAFSLGQPQQLVGLSISDSQSGNAAPLANAVLRLFAHVAPPVSITSISAQIGLRSYFESVGVLVSRPTPGGKLAVSIKAGGNGNHSHNDIGSYTIALDTEQPTGDPGATVYSSKTFSRDRYSIRGINSWGHPVPVVDGALQREATKVKVKVLATHFSNAEDVITIDTSSAYDVSGLRRLTRTLNHERVGAGKVTIEDRFEFASPRDFEVALICTGNCRERDEGVLELWQKKERLLAHIEASSPYEIRREEVDEEGLAFTRIAIHLKQAQREGFVRVRYLPR